MAKHKHTIINGILYAIIGTVLTFSLAFLVTLCTPFEYNIEISKLDYSDICLGSNLQTITTQRKVRPETVVTHISSVAWRKEQNKWIKTDIIRNVTVPYEENGNKEFSIEIQWDKPFTKLGEYGVSSHIDIYPYAVKKTRVENYKQKTFRVIEC